MSNIRQLHIANSNYEVENNGLAGGSGNELEVNNILLDFAVGNVTALGFAGLHPV